MAWQREPLEVDMILAVVLLSVAIVGLLVIAIDMGATELRRRHRRPWWRSEKPARRKETWL